MRHVRCWTLAVALLLLPVAWARAGAPSKPRAQAPAEQPRSPSATVVIDLLPGPGAPNWLARSFEETLTREISGLSRLTIVLKQNANAHTSRCGASNLSCRVRAYRAAKIDVVLFGEITDGGIDYELYQTWTPARLTSGTIATGPSQSSVGLSHAIRDVLHPVLKQGGLLDQRRYAFEQGSFVNLQRFGWSTRVLAMVGLFAVFLALPFVFLVRRTGELRLLENLRTARWTAVLVLATGFALLLFDQHSIAGLIGSRRWLCSCAGGLAMGLLLVVFVRDAFRPLEGLERIPHQDLFPILTTWLFASVERIVWMAVLYAPFGLAVGWVGRYLEIPDIWTVFLLAPAVGFAARLWFLSWVECVAVLVDRRYVDGPATRDNPWSRAITEYLMGYVRRTGWDLDAKRLDSTVFLPGDVVGGVVSYGGGATHARVVIDKKLLELAMGRLDRNRPDDGPAGWPDWTTSIVVASHSTARRRKSVKGDRYLNRDRQAASDPGAPRKQLGQPATLLGYLIPAPPDHAPTIAHSTLDVASVRELLSEHYVWRAPDLNEEHDATDPTDKDMLFGALARELGVVGRQESQLSTIKLALQIRLDGLTDRYRWRLADSYAAVNYARHHLIQYLYYRWSSDLLPLTARARGDRLAKTTHKIVDKVRFAPPDQSERLRHFRNRLGWLSELSAEPGKHPERGVARGVVASVAMIGIAAAMWTAIQRARLYHPTYVKRIERQQRDIAESRKKGLADGDARDTAAPQKE